jgi:hypothetical protein
MARRSEIGDLGLAESMPTNTEITINKLKTTLELKWQLN